MNLIRTSLMALALVVCLGSQAAWGEGWSWPFSSSDHKSASARKAAQEPSAWQKMNDGTKEFFGRVGETLSLKKPQQKKKKTPHPYNPWVKQTKKEKSWFSSWFAPKEPEPPQSLREWMELEPIRP